MRYSHGGFGAGKRTSSVKQPHKYAGVPLLSVSSDQNAQTTVSHPKPRTPAEVRV